MADPWRYECINCGSVSVSKRTRKDISAPVNQRCDGYAEYWYCNGCHSSYPEVYDKKNSVTVTAPELAPGKDYGAHPYFQSWPG